MALKHSCALLLAAFVSLTSALSHAAPTINTNPSSATPALGSTATLAASVSAESGATFVWTRDGTTIINGGRYSGATTATLSIARANASDNGSYTLTVTDGTGSTPTVPATLNVNQLGGVLDSAYNGAGANGSNAAIYTNTALHLPDGRTLLAVKNQFNGVSGTATSNLVVMSVTGVASHPGAAGFAGGSNGGDVSCIFRMGDGKILVGGDFTTHRTDTVVNTPRNKVARLNADLTLDTTFVATGPSAKPSVIFADSYGRIYIGGTFNDYDGSFDYRNLVRLNADGTLDTSFKPGLNGGVTSVVFQSDGKFIVGGLFVSRSAFPSTNVPSLVRFLADGTLDTSFAPTFSTDYATQTSLAVDADDNLYVGRSGATGTVFKLLPNGSLASGYTAPSLSGQINTIAVLLNGKLAISGFFTTPTSRFMVLNTDGSQDAGFSVGTGFNSVNGATSIQSIVPDLLGRIWIMGINFSTYNGSAANRFAVLQGSGSPSLFFTAQPGGRTANQGSAVSFSAAASGNNGFTYQWQKNGSPLSNGGNVSGATTDTLTLTNIQETDQAAYTVVVSSPEATSVTSRVASLDVLGIPEITQDPVAQTVDFGDTTTFTGAATGATPLTYQWYYGTTALVNGTGVSGATTNTLTLTNIDFNDAGQYSLKATNGLGNDLSAEATLTVQKRPDAIVAGNLPTFVGVGYGGYVSAIQPLTDGSYIVGGAFDRVTINGVNTTRKGLARILADGTLDTNFPTVESPYNAAVEAVTIDSAGRIFIAGDFNAVVVGGTSTPRIRVARLTSTFALDTAFNTSTVGPDKIVHALAAVGDGSVYIGGEFSNIGTTAIRYIAKLNATGARDTGFTNSISTGTQDNNKSVNSICRLANGTLYVGSSVSSWGTSLLPGQPAGRLVKLSASGARDLGFASPDIFTIINAIIALPDGSLFAGGNAFGQPYLKRLNGSTGADLGYSLAGHALQSYALHRQADGKLLSGSYGVLKRTDANLAVDPGFNIGTGFDNYIRAITTDSKGRIYVGGEFGNLNGVSRNRFVILNGGVLDSRTTPKPGQTITFADIADRAFVPGNAVANTVTITLPTSSSALPVSTVVTSGPAILVGNKLTFTGAGSVVLTASQAGNGDFMAASVSQTIEVSKAAQTLSFAPLIDRPTGTAPFLLGAAASSGLPVSYQVLGGPASVIGNVLTLTGATGVVSLRASQPGNSDFTAAAAVDQSFDVFTGTPAKLPQTIVFNPMPGRSLSEALTFTINAGATSGLPLTFTFTGPVTSIVGNTVTLSGVAGTVAITAKQAGNANFLAAADVKQSFAVTAAATALTLTNLTQTYTGTPRAVGTVGGTGSPVISYTIGGVKGTTPPTNAGSYPVEAVIGTGVTAVKKTGSLVINKAPLIVAADDKRKFTGQDNPVLTFAYSGFLGSDNATNALTKAPNLVTTATKTSPGGNYPITPAAGASTNYAFVYVNGTLKVETFAAQYEALLTAVGSAAPVAKLEITITATGATFTGKLTTAKDLTPFALAGPITPDFVNETASFAKSFTLGTGTAAVTYNITFTTPLDGDFSATVTRATGTPPGSSSPFGSTSAGKKLLLLSGTPPVAYAGAHTSIMGTPVPLTTSVLPLPSGFGYATAFIDIKGKMTYAGALPDGTKFTAGLLPDKDTGYRLYLQPYAARLDSYFGGWLPLTAHPNLTGRGYIPSAAMVQLFWARQAKTTDTNYRGGIPESAMATILDPWQPPLAAKTPDPAITLVQRLDLNATGDMNVIHDGLGSVTTTGMPTLVNMNSAGLLTVPITNPRAWKLTITAATGMFTGSYSVQDGAIPRLVNVTGIMRQPAVGEADPAVLGAGQGLLPQLTGATAGTTSAGISFTRPASD
jgi:uncharacterized delta-60 repeat protein